MTVHQKKRDYVRITTTRPAGEAYNTTEGRNYREYPIVAIYGNDDRKTDLNNAGLSKLRARNLKETLYSNEVFRLPIIAMYIYGYGGNPESLQKMQHTMWATGIFPTEERSDQGAGIHPFAFDVKFEEHEATIKRYRAGICNDWVFLDQEVVSGGSLTNTVIKAHFQRIDTRAGDKEKLAADALRRLLLVAGHDVDISDIHFQHATLVNEAEVTDRVVKLVGENIITPEIGAELEPLIANKGEKFLEKVQTALAQKSLALPEAVMAALEAQQTGGAIDDEGAE